MKILCIGMNYAAHNQEMSAGNNVKDSTLLNTEPVIFSKPESAVILKGKPFFVPDFAERFDYETELIVRIDRLGKDISERFAHRYYSEVTVGIDFTARDLQQQLIAKGLPWDICKGFDQSAAIGRFVKKDTLPEIQNLHLRLDIDGNTVQQGCTSDMIHTVDKIVSYCSRFFTLKMGDLIFTGTPAGVGPVSEGQTLEAYLEDQQLLKLKIK